MRPLSFYVPPEDKNVEKMLKAIADRGLKSVGTDGINWMERRDPKPILERFAEMLERFDLKVSSVHFTGANFNRIGKSQGPVLDNIKIAIDNFSFWKPSAIVMHWGWPWPAKVDQPLTCEQIVEVLQQQENQYGTEALEQVQAENFIAVAKHAAQYNMNIAVENMPWPWPNGTDPAQIRRLIDLIDEPNVGICLDSGHAHLSGYNVADAVRTIGSKLCTTHFHDNVGAKDQPAGKPHRDMHTSVGLGTINWFDVIRALDEIGFAGPVNFEGGGMGEELDAVLCALDLFVSNWRAFEDILNSKS